MSVECLSNVNASNTFEWDQYSRAVSDHDHWQASPGRLGCLDLEIVATAFLDARDAFLDARDTFIEVWLRTRMASAWSRSAKVPTPGRSWLVARNPFMTDEIGQVPRRVRHKPKGPPNGRDPADRRRNAGRVVK